MKEVTYIDPVSTAKVAAILGILWALLGWVFSSVVITLLIQSDQYSTELPQAFSTGGLISGLIGGFVGGGLSGYIGCLVYNFLVPWVGGVKVGFRE